MHRWETRPKLSISCLFMTINSKSMESQTTRRQHLSQVLSKSLKGPTISTITTYKIKAKKVCNNKQKNQDSILKDSEATLTT